MVAVGDWDVGGWRFQPGFKSTGACTRLGFSGFAAPKALGQQRMQLCNAADLKQRLLKLKRRLVRRWCELGV